MLRLTLVLALAALAATACSKSAPPNAGSPPASISPSSSNDEDSYRYGASSTPSSDHGTKDLTASGSAVSADVDAYEFYFEPTTFKARSGAKVTLEVSNEGKAEHNFSITSLHVDKDLEPGTKATVTFTLPPNGTVAFFCKYHQARGMQGRFVLS